MEDAEYNLKIQARLTQNPPVDLSIWTFLLEYAGLASATVF